MYSWRRLTISTSGTSSLLHTSVGKRKHLLTNKSTLYKTKKCVVWKIYVCTYKQQVFDFCHHWENELERNAVFKASRRECIAGCLLSVFSVAADRIDSCLPRQRGGLTAPSAGACTPGTLPLPNSTSNCLHFVASEMHIALAICPMPHATINTPDAAASIHNSRQIHNARY